MQTRHLLISVVVASLALGACSQRTAQGSAPAAAAAGAAGSASSPAAAPTAALVTIETGTLQGVVAGGVESFKGIPYAAPPVGDLRWEPPQPPAHWSGVRQATAFAHDCAQQPFRSDAAPLRTTPSEDCLYLNVWRPVGAHGLPVMVWIYGGGFVNGGTSPAAYDGTHLAAKGVLLVSFNYRLGRFGFFAFPALSAERPHGLLGNYGYLDQLAALRWVQTNIAAFGGDPHNVTVFGQSAGGASVQVLLTSPLASGLFQKAAIESGLGYDSTIGHRRLAQNLPGLPSAEAVGVSFARANGIRGTGAAALAALRALPPDKIIGGLGFLSLLQSLQQPPPGPPTYAGPMVDGRIVVQTPETAYRSGRFAHVPLLIGATDADFGINTARTMAAALAPFGADRRRALALYDPQHSNDVRWVGRRIASDRDAVEPARFDATEFAEHGLRVFEYRFSYVAPAAAVALQSSPFAKTAVPGAQHSSDIPYVFDTIGAVLGAGVTAADEATAEAASTYWTNFAKTGNPSGASDSPANDSAAAAALPAWPAYSPKTDLLMNFTQGGPVPMRDPWHTRLDLTAAHAH